MAIIFYRRAMVCVLLFLLFLTTPIHAYDRIISLKPNLTQILFSLGVGDKIVGVTSFCDDPPEAKKRPAVADYLQVDLEKIIAQKPDLIITSQENASRREIEFLIGKGYKVLMVDTGNLKNLRQAIQTLGDALGKSDEAKSIGETMNADLEVLNQKKNEMKKQGVFFPRVLFVVSYQPLIVAGGGTFFEDAAQSLGFINAAGESQLKYPTYSYEQLLAAKPDLILDFSMGSESQSVSQTDRLKWWEKFKTVPAVQKGKIYFLDPALLRADTKLIKGWMKMFEVVYGSLTSPRPSP